MCFDISQHFEPIGQSTKVRERVRPVTLGPDDDGEMRIRHPVTCIDALTFPLLTSWPVGCDGGEAYHRRLTTGRSPPLSQMIKNSTTHISSTPRFRPLFESPVQMQALQTTQPYPTPPWKAFGRACGLSWPSLVPRLALQRKGFLELANGRAQVAKTGHLDLTLALAS